MRMIALIAVEVIALAPSPANAQRVKASYYSCCSKTASGERFNPHGMTAAHRSLPFGTKVRVSYRGKTVVVRVNDRGPFIHNRGLDLSLGAARAIGLTARGVDVVTMEVL